MDIGSALTKLASFEAPIDPVPLPGPAPKAEQPSSEQPTGLHELPPFPPGLGLPGGARRAEDAGDATPTGDTFTDADLYGPNGPEPQDIDQDDLGDCYFVATLAGLANSAEGDARIEESITYNEDTGTFTVTFFEEGPLGIPVPVQVEVTQGDIQDNIDRNGGSTVDNQGSGPIWPAVMEAAYAKHAGENATFAEKIGAGVAGISQMDLGYQLIEGGKARNALFDLTGTRGTDIDNAFVDRWGTGLTMFVINQALEDGRSVTLSTDPENVGAAEDGLADNHVYQVERIYVDEDTGEVMVELRNPWAHNNTEGHSNNSAIVTVPLSQITEDGGFEYFNIGPEG
ncbi:C2 family cysteine protease [Luteimonas sp. A501]